MDGAINRRYSKAQGLSQRIFGALLIKIQITNTESSIEEWCGVSIGLGVPGGYYIMAEIRKNGGNNIIDIGPCISLKNTTPYHSYEG